MLKMRVRSVRSHLFWNREKFVTNLRILSDAVKNPILKHAIDTYLEFFNTTILTKRFLELAEICFSNVDSVVELCDEYEKTPHGVPCVWRAAFSLEDIMFSKVPEDNMVIWLDITAVHEGKFTKEYLAASTGDCGVTPVEMCGWISGMETRLDVILRDELASLHASVKDHPLYQNYDDCDVSDDVFSHYLRILGWNSVNSSGPIDAYDTLSRAIETKFHNETFAQNVVYRQFRNEAYTNRDKLGALALMHREHRTGHFLVLRDAALTGASAPMAALLMKDCVSQTDDEFVEEYTFASGAGAGVGTSSVIISHSYDVVSAAPNNAAPDSAAASAATASAATAPTAPTASEKPAVARAAMKPVTQPPHR